MMPTDRGEMRRIRWGALAHHRLILDVIQGQRTGALIRRSEARRDAPPAITGEYRPADIGGDRIAFHGVASHTSTIIDQAKRSMPVAPAAASMA